MFLEFEMIDNVWKIMFETKKKKNRIICHIILLHEMTAEWWLKSNNKWSWIRNWIPIPLAR
jgi:hypothetical protein